MKFLSPSFKAKYQIADEKVAGRSVRMKCRKFGHLIQVSSVVGVGDAIMGSEPPPAIDTASATTTEPPEAQASAPKSEPNPEPKPEPKAEARPEPRRPAPAP